MANYFSGKDGSLTFNGERVGKVASWSLSAKVEAMEVTSLEDTARDFTPGIKDASGSASVWMYQDNAGAPTAATPLLNKVFRTGATSDADVYRMALEYGTHRLVFDCILTTADLACSVGAVMQTTISFQVCGDLIEAGV